ncbi:MAG TPA: MCE family protein [Nocardioides sp.]|uniref:MCE family protein n=1 Tax=uncultured Nocardioides sp. TaxID=198441 RepID=UPI000ECE3D41|nr:MCE family protein [uncultured Nocardioides sp.]HCB03905.1 virulence factor Mce [Nocardioides sp.]HRD61628.1 MCE family protein [Nocardioides sp.]HRI95730.1 MCE family protein [Nocardioides sp.]HRK46231.1 MCE family protein [Nocardioides sp.]
MSGRLGTAKRLVVPLVILALVAAAGWTMFRGGDQQKTLTAHFPRTISIYEGSEVKVLGVGIGSVDKVTPSGTEVVVEMHYDPEVDLPADAKAVIVAPSIVGDRYVQITPVYESGPTLADGATLRTEDTSVPLELDQIYSSLDDLNVALGPNGANKNGALSDLLDVTADNFGGQGAQLHQTIEDFSALSQTLDDNKDELFGSARELEGFINTLATNDQTVRQFNQALSGVSDLLSGEKEELAAALHNLSVGLGDVATFVRENRDILGKNIQHINRVAKVLVKQREALDETLTDAPLALNNLALAYNPQAGTLDTNANLGELVNQIGSDPATLVCGFLGQADKSGQLCNLASQVLKRSAPFGTGSSYGQPFDQSLGGLVEVAP